MRVRVITAALLIVLAGGCARGDVTTGAPAPVPARSGAPAPDVHDRWKSCDTAAPPSVDDWFTAGQDALGLPRLDDGFRPVAAIVCRVEMREVPGTGMVAIAEEVRADDLTALLSALRLPDEPATAEACTEELPLVPWLALVDRDGRWIRPGVPIDSCRKPRIEFRQAYGALVTTVVTSRRLPGR